MKAHRIIRILLLLLACSAEVVLAQDKQNMFNPVNTSVTSLAIAPDARAGAMGDIGAATEADVYSQYWNPAKYPFNIARAGVGISYTPWLRKLVNDINLANLTGFYRIGDYSAVHASLRYFSLGEVYLADMDDMTIKPYEMAIDAGYSRMLSETFSMAVNLRFILSDIKYDYTAESSAGKAFAVDFNKLTGEEGPHAVAQKKIGHIREFLLRVHAKTLHVADHAEIAFFFGKESELGFICDRTAVSEMIIADDIEPLRGHKGRKAVVAVDKFDHAVGDLQDPTHFSFRDPFDGMDLCQSVFGRIKEFLFHDVSSSPSFGYGQTFLLL